MPELPDVTLYVEHLDRRIAGATLESSRVISPNLLRTVDPPLEATHGKRVLGVRRVGKRVVIELEEELFLVFHLMIAGRFHWKDAGAAPSPSRRGARSDSSPPPSSRAGPGKNGLAAFEFTTGTLALTEASRKQRASLHVVAGEEELEAIDPGGVEPLTATFDEFRAAVSRENHTLKRALTDPRLVSGIGNSYSDEILHRARLSPLQLTSRLDGDTMRRLHTATREVLSEWTDRLRAQYGDSFPERVTAFREGMAVHGRFRQPCPACGAPVQRIVHAENETNYCPRCQTGGRLLADRALSRLLHDDWPRTLEQMEG